MPRRQTLNAQLRAARLAAGMTQYELAHATGLPQEFISRLESGKKPLNAYHIIAIAKATGGVFPIDGQTTLVKRS